MSFLGRTRLAREDGFTMSEVMIGMLIMLIVVGALAAGFVRNSDSALSAQRQATLVAVAQQQMEKVHQLATRYGFEALALTGAPTPGNATLPANPDNPNDFVRSSATKFLIENNYNDTTAGQVSTAPSSGETILVDAAAGRIDPTSTTAVAGGGTATIYTYVTQASLPCHSSVLGVCSAGDGRRVIVAAVLSNPGTRKTIGPNKPTYVSTLFSNPIPSNQPSNANGLRLGLDIG